MTRILVITDLYPPHFVGGYELICKDVVDGLRRRGNEILVLTSTFGVEGSCVEAGVQRRLTYCDGDGNPPVKGMGRRLRVELHESRLLRETTAHFCPDVIFIWHPWFLLRSLLMTAQRTAVPLVFYFLDYWLENYYTATGDHWFQWWARTSKKRHKQLIKAVVQEPLRRLVHVVHPTRLDTLFLNGSIFGSEFLRDEYARQGLSTSASVIIRPGIRVADFSVRASRAEPAPIRCLYVGRLVEEKGVHIALEAIERLVAEGCDVTLSIVGDADPGREEYSRRLRAQVDASRLGRHVRFCGKIPSDQMASVYAEHDILLFPSLWDEPFGRTILEAMASGLAVVSTATGGTREFLRDEVNCLICSRANGVEFARQITRLLNEVGLRDRLAHASAFARDHFDLAKTVVQIQDHLTAVISQRGRGRVEQRVGQ